MTATIVSNERLGLEFPESIDLSGKRFLEFCAANRDLRIERNADGEIIIMPPTDSETGRRNSHLNRQLGNWADQDGTGLVFDSSTGFELPNGSTKSPDASWISKSRLKLVTKSEGFMKVCPDFVVELRSPSDRLPKVKAKMEEYIANGAKLGWLLDPLQKKAYIYQPNNPVEERDRPKRLKGDPLLPGFTLNLEPIWATNLERK